MSTAPGDTVGIRRQGSRIVNISKDAGTPRDLEPKQTYVWGWVVARSLCSNIDCGPVVGFDGGRTVIWDGISRTLLHDDTC